jgi:hypothetical protein
LVRSNAVWHHAKKYAIDDFIEASKQVFEDAKTLTSPGRIL